MGSNEVIIDGCNVAECELCSTDWKNRYVCEITSISMKYNHFCNENPNCHFKQLQRAKAEKQEKVLKMAEAEIEIEKLQVENEKLKAEIKKLSS